MNLAEYAKQMGRGSLAGIGRKTGITYASMLRFAHGLPVSRYDTAKKIAGATGGLVSIEELCEPELCTPKLEPAVAEPASAPPNGGAP